MIIQIILSVIVVCLFLYTLYQGDRFSLLKTSFLISLALGFFLVWQPDFSTTVANFLGIGRGTDLMLYLLIIANIIILANVHARFMSINEEMTTAFRQIALLEQELDEQAINKSKSN